MLSNSKSLVDWNNICFDFYLAYHNRGDSFVPEISSLIDDVCKLNRYESCNATCSVMQLLSRCLKDDRCVSHPERQIGKKINKDDLNINNKSNHKYLIQVIWSKILEIYRVCANTGECHLYYFLLCLMLDTIKTEKNISYVMNSTIIELETISITIDVIKLCYPKLTYIPACLKAFSILSHVLKICEPNNNFTALNTNLNTPIYISVCTISKDLFEMFQLNINNILQSYNNNHINISSHCNFIDSQCQVSFFPSSLVYLSHLLNATVLYICTLISNEDHTIIISKESTIHLLLSYIADFSDLFIHFITISNPKTILKLLSENDEDLITFLTHFIEIEIRIDHLYKHTIHFVTTNNDMTLITKSDDHNLSNTFHGNKNIEISNDSTSHYNHRISHFYHYTSDYNNKLNSLLFFVIFLLDCICSDVVVLSDLIFSPETFALKYILRITKLLLNFGTNKTPLLQVCRQYLQEDTLITSLTTADTSVDAAQVEQSTNNKQNVALIWVSWEHTENQSCTFVRPPIGDSANATERIAPGVWESRRHERADAVLQPKKGKERQNWRGGDDQMEDPVSLGKSLYLHVLHVLKDFSDHLKVLSKKNNDSIYNTKLLQDRIEIIYYNLLEDVNK